MQAPSIQNGCARAVALGTAFVLACSSFSFGHLRESQRSRLPSISTESKSSQLVGAAVFSRHGSRTPTHPMQCPPPWPPSGPRPEPKALMEAKGDNVWPFLVGAGQLTPVGRKESLLLGQLLGQLYLRKFPCASEHGVVENDNIVPAVARCVDVFSSTRRRAKETAVFILEALSSFGSSKALPEDVFEEQPHVLPLHASRDEQWDSKLEPPGRAFRSMWDDVEASRLEELYSRVHVLDNKHSKIILTGYKLQTVKNDKRSFRNGYFAHRSVVARMWPAVEGFRAIGCDIASKEAVPAHMADDLASLYQAKLSYESHALPLPSPFDNLPEEVWDSASFAADKFWRNIAPTAKAAWFAGAAALVEATQRLTLLASRHAGRPIVSNFDKWPVISQSYSARLGNVAPLAVYAGHRSSVVSFQRALHVQESDLYVPDFIGWLSMELWHDVELERRCLKNTHNSDELHCAAVAYGVRILLNGRRLLLFPRAVVALDCELLGDLSDRCAARRTSTVSLMSIQNRIIADWQRFGDVTSG